MTNRVEGPVLRETRQDCAQTGITEPDQVRATLEHFRWGSPSVTWTVVRRTTRITEEFDDELART